MVSLICPTVLLMTGGVVAVPAVAKMRPLGNPRFARFSRLKNSERNWRLIRSVIGVLLVITMSNLAIPGACSVSRPAFPIKEPPSCAELL